MRITDLGSSVSVVVSHSNGTRYSLVIVPDPDGGRLVCWSDGRWMGWVDPRTYPARYVPTRAGKIGDADHKAIREILSCPDVRGHLR